MKTFISPHKRKPPAFFFSSSCNVVSSLHANKSPLSGYSQWHGKHFTPARELSFKVRLIQSSREFYQFGPPVTQGVHTYFAISTLLGQWWNVVFRWPGADHGVTFIDQGEIGQWAFRKRTIWMLLVSWSSTRDRFYRNRFLSRTGEDKSL